MLLFGRLKSIMIFVGGLCCLSCQDHSNEFSQNASDQKSDQQLALTQKDSGSACRLDMGSYQVQSVVYDQAHEHFKMILLNAPNCLKQPYVADRIVVSELKDEGKAHALLKVDENLQESLLVKKDFPLNIIGQAKQDDRQNSSDETSASSSSLLSSVAQGLIAGAVGGAIGSAISNKISQNRRDTQGQVLPSKASSVDGREGVNKTAGAVTSKPSAVNPDGYLGNQGSTAAMSSPVQKSAVTASSASSSGLSNHQGQPQKKFNLSRAAARQYKIKKLNRSKKRFKKIRRRRRR